VNGKSEDKLNTLLLENKLCNEGDTSNMGLFFWGEVFYDLFAFTQNGSVFHNSFHFGLNINQ
jgi:hypothetical protein